MSAVRVLLVDDQELARSGLEMMLAGEPGVEVVGQAQNGLEGVEEARRLGPDVVLMDIRMPVMDGLAATRRIRALGESPPRVVVLTTFDLDEYVFEAFRAGASGYLLKDARRDRVVEAVRAAADGDALVSPSVTRRLIEHFAVVPRGRPRRDETLERLTDREREVLELIGRGLSNSEIAAELVLSESTVKTHVGRILGKLDVRDRVQAVVLAYESGVVVPGEPRERD